jgi:hypothetical protein
MKKSPQALPALGEIHEYHKDPMGYISQKTQPQDLSVRKPEKEIFGEVFTPPAIINAMLDQIPPHLWSDPTKKWLDPAAGFGNFPMMVYARLMTGLAETHPDPAERSRHIIQRMLYMVELNLASFERIQRTFGSTVNVLKGSFLVAHLSFPDGTTDQFDIIIGNPPFNAEQTHEGKPGGGAILWPKFVEKSLVGSLLKENAYLLFVHPALWRKPPSDRAKTLFDVMVHENHMLYLEIHSKPDGLRDFGVQTRYDFYIIQKRRPTPQRDFTRVKDQLGGEAQQIDLSEWQFLPNHSFGLIQPLLLSKTQEDYVIFSRGQYGSDKPWVSKTKNDVYTHPVVHSTPMKGHRIYWSSNINDDCKDCKKMFGVPKVIFGESGINNAICDIGGKFGMTQGAIGLKIPAPIETDGPMMKTALESEVFKRILDAMSFSNFRIDWRMFLFIRPDFYRDSMFQDSGKFRRPRDVDAAGDADPRDEGDLTTMRFTKVVAAKKPRPPTKPKGGRTRRRKTIRRKHKHQLRHTRKKY